MIKRIAIHVGISLVICLILQVTGIISHLEFYEKLFIAALLYLLAGGYIFLCSAGYFAIQKYSFHKVSSKLPFLSKLFLGANARNQEIGDEKETAKDFVDYRDNFMKKTSMADCVPLLLTFTILTSISVAWGMLAV